MSANLMGKYISKNLTTTTDGDLIAQLETALGKSIVVKKLTLITTATITIKINDATVWSDLYADADGVARLSLDGNDVVISNLYVHENAASVFLAVIYQG